jgi:hypothetical protein
MSYGERERKKSTMDSRIIKKMIREQEVKRCKNGHLNSINATICWICGEPLGKD